MPEIDENRIKKLKEENECCPACTNIETCRAYNENGEVKFPESYKWSPPCCEKCNDITCTQNPFYIISFLKKDITKPGIDSVKDYYEEALHTIITS